MAFPSGPSNGQKHTESGVTYIYVSSYGVWDIFDPNQDISAADVLTKIKTVDGASSGLDADLLDGLSSSAFVRTDQNTVSIQRHLDAVSTWGGGETLFLNWHGDRVILGNNSNSVHDTAGAYPNPAIISGNEHYFHDGVVSPQGVYGARSGAPSGWIWRISKDSYPTYGIYYAEGNPDQIQYRWSDSTKAYVNLETGAYWTNSEFITASDERLKENIKPIENALDTVTQLNGVTYTKDDKDSIGVIAQEINKVLPQLVTKNEQGYLSVNYQGIIPLLVEAIKEQQEQIDELKEKLNG